MRDQRITRPIHNDFLYIVSHDMISSNFNKSRRCTNQITMMVQSHDNDWFNIFPCDFQLRTKKINYHIHIAHLITRHLAHHEFTQDRIYCRFIYRIAITQMLQPCPHLIYRMDILETFGTSDFVESPSGSPPSMDPSLDLSSTSFAPRQIELVRLHSAWRQLS